MDGSAAPAKPGVPSESHHTPFYDSVTSGSIPSSQAQPSNPKVNTLDSQSAEVTNGKPAVQNAHTLHESISSKSSTESTMMQKEDSHFMPIQPARTNDSQKRPGHHSRTSSYNAEDLFRTLSRRRTSVTSKSDAELQDEHAEIERLMSRMFGKDRQAHSEDEKTRHVGVVFRDLTVRGMGLGAALQPTTGDFFLGLPRLVKNFISRGPKAAFGKPPVRELLSDFNGAIRPGEMLLVLGRPGSGCSTFLKVLGNQRFGYVSVDGDVTYGGTDAKKMAKDFRGEVLYNPEDDLHYATLTVQQTLKFALRTRTPGKESRNEGESRADYVREFLKVVLKLFWIEHTVNTKVGDEFVRGVSGGEKKRVSIAEAMITKASVQAWDNSTRGLDASTALEYVQSIRTLTNMAHVSTAVALYQAGESLYELFDKVLLIDEGKCLYYGSADRAKEYFFNLGFDCPDRWTTADFLTSVTDEHERSIREGWEDRIPRSAAQFAAAFQKSDAFQWNLDDMAEFEKHLEEQRRERLANTSKKNKKKNFTLPFHQQVMACTKRQVLVILGDRASLIGKWGGLTFQGLIVGSLFYNMPATSAGAFTRGGVLFLILLFNALLAMAEMTSAFQAKPILLKHKTFSFYRPAAYGIAQTVVDIPLALIQVLILDLIIYFMSDLQRTASQFFISVLILWIVTMAMYSFFRGVASVCRTLDSATRITGIAIQALVVYTGYLIPPRKMHPWFSWLRWINPVQYGFEALMANEFYNLEMKCVPPNLVPQGPDARPQYQSCTLQGSEPGQTIVNGARYIEVAFGYTRSHLWRNFGILVAFWVFFVAMTVYGMEAAKPNAGGGAVTIFKRGQVPKQLEKSIESGGQTAEDEEKGKAGESVDAITSSSSDEELKREATTSGVAKNEIVFTFRNIDYLIPYEGNERRLLSDVQGFVRPGKLTALMGASGEFPYSSCSHC
jgi:ATP-binding cassette subfamily G (WHITE) protein 2 (SNQ2)